MQYLVSLRVAETELELKLELEFLGGGGVGGANYTARPQELRVTMTRLQQLFNICCQVPGLIVNALPLPRQLPLPLPPPRYFYFLLDYSEI